MIVSGVTGAFLTGDANDGHYKPWVFFALGFCFFLPIVYELGFGIPLKMKLPASQRLERPQVSSVPDSVRAGFCCVPKSRFQRRATFDIVAWLTIVTWTLYP